MTDVIGAIRQKWLALGGGFGYGEPLDVERPTFDGVGRWQPFGKKGGIIVWHPTDGAFEVHGLIAQAWIRLGREKWGYPITDERTTPDKRGRYNHFRTTVSPGFPEASIYFAPWNGAHEVHGAIRATWAELGWERSKLGYPRSDERPLGEGGRRNEFDRGQIEWTPDGHTHVHESAQI